MFSRLDYERNAKRMKRAYNERRLDSENYKVCIFQVHFECMFDHFENKFTILCFERIVISGSYANTLHVMFSIHCYIA